MSYQTTSDLCLYTPKCVCLLCPFNLVFVIKPGPPCSSVQRKKKKVKSYIFYKLSAVKEGAKIKTINTVHNYLFLLPQPSVIFEKSLSLVTERTEI